MSHKCFAILFIAFSILLLLTNLALLTYWQIISWKNYQDIHSHQQKQIVVETILSKNSLSFLSDNIALGSTQSFIELGRVTNISVNKFAFIFKNEKIKETKCKSLFEANIHTLQPSKEIRASSILTVNNIRSLASQSMKIVSPTDQVFILGPKKVAIQSFGGYISLESNLGVTLKSATVKIASSIIQVPNLHMTKSNLTKGFQVCTCFNGKLFLAGDDSYCKANYHICNSVV